MAFSDAFARGYAIGDAMKKRKAASDFFEKFKELSANADYDPESETEVIKLEPKAGEAAAAIPALAPESPVAAPSTPENPTVEVAPVDAAAAPSPALDMTPAQAREAPTDVPPAEAPPAPGAMATPETVKEAIPLSMPTEMKITKPEEIDTRGTARKLFDKATGNEPKKARSFTQEDMKELDSLALAAGEAAGDVEVYNALKATTDSFIKGKIQKNLALASTAVSQGDDDAVQKYMKRAYMYVPDGNHLDFKRDKEGRLTVQSPWEAKDRIPVTAETISWMNMQLYDPDKFADLMQRERHHKEEMGLKGREVAVSERRATTDERQAATQERMTDAQIKDMADRLGISQQELGIKGRAQTLEELNSRVSRFSQYSQGLYYQELANKMKSGGVDADGKPLKGLTLDDARETWHEVDGQFKSYTQPPKNDMGVEDKNWTKPADVEGLSPAQLQEANGLAQTIALGAPSDVSAATATKAALALTRAATPNAQGTGMLDKVDINFDNGTLRLRQGNGFVEVPLPRSILNNYAQQANARAATDERIRTHGFPGTAPMNPMAALPLAPR